MSLRQAQVAREAWIAQHPAEVAWERDLRARIEVVAASRSGPWRRLREQKGGALAWTATGDAFGRAIATPGAARPRDRSGLEATATRVRPHGRCGVRDGEEAVRERWGALQRGSTTGHGGCLSRRGRRRSVGDRSTCRSLESVALPRPRRHLFAETDRDAAAKLDAIRAGGLDGRGAPDAHFGGNRQELPCLRVAVAAYSVHELEGDPGPSPTGLIAIR